MSKITITDTFRKVDSLNPDEAQRWLSEKKEDDFTLLDVSEPEEYEEGHIPGALLIPLTELLDRTNELDYSKPVVTYCKKGMRSRSAAALLMGQGVQKAYSIEGGIDSWNGVVAIGSYEAGMFLLEGRKTVEEVLFLSWALEEGTRSFYEKVGGIVNDKEAKQLFDSLVKAEERHKSMLFDIYREIKGRDITYELLKEGSVKGFMEGGISIEETVNWVKTGERSLRDILELSMQIETNSLDLYLKMLHEVGEENAKMIFHNLIDEEKAHLSRLGRLLGRMVKESNE